MYTNKKSLERGSGLNLVSVYRVRTHFLAEEDGVLLREPPPLGTAIGMHLDGECGDGRSESGLRATPAQIKRAPSEARGPIWSLFTECGRSWRAGPWGSPRSRTKPSRHPAGCRSRPRCHCGGRRIP